MIDMVVAQDDKKLFLDKVISFGIDHGILTRERRQQLVQESADLSHSLCERYGLNPMALADVLLAARIVHQLTSIALERVSHSNTSVAAHLLATTKVSALVGLVLVLINGAYRRIWKVARCSDGTAYAPVQYDFSIILNMFWLRHSPYAQDKVKGSRSPTVLDSEADRTENMSKLRIALRQRQQEVLSSMRASYDLDQWLNEVDTTARELIAGSAKKRR